MNASVRCSLQDRWISLLLAVLFAAGFSGCGEGLDGVPSSDSSEKAPPRVAPESIELRDDSLLPHRTLRTDSALADFFQQGRALLDPGTAFHQVSLMFDAAPGTELEWRRPEDPHWRPVEVTWSEGRAHVGRILLERPAKQLELRASAPLSYLHLEFPPRITARTDAPLTRELPPVRKIPQPKGDLQTTRQREAPDRLVIPREEWGARDPDKICGRSHDPYRMTIHHTADPPDDGGDPALRMRQMQAFHIDDRGWCDIGYHFVVSQSAEIFQGRSTEKRTGAHVGGENFGNIGISLIGNFENQTVDTRQFESMIDIADWVHSTFDITLDRDHVKGHTEWPGQGTSCPGRNLKSRLDEVVRKTANHDGGEPTETDVAVRTEILDLSNRYGQGSSSELPDALPGERFRAAIRVTNRTDAPLEELQTSYELESPYVDALSYEIQTDDPEKEGSSWRRADTSSGSSNPNTDDPPNSGTFDLGFLAEDETKRILLELRAKRYRLGVESRPAVRAWVRSIRDVYGPQTSWNGTPQTNDFAARLQDGGRLDIPSPNEWRFESTETQQNLEGWTGCCEGDVERLALNHEAGALAVKVKSTDVTLQSPDWTSIDAETYDEMVLRARAHDGPHVKRIVWHQKGTPSSETHSLRYRAPGDGTFHAFRIPLGRHPGWSGTIDSLRIEPRPGEPPERGAKRWYDIDGIYFRSSDSGENTTEREAFDPEGVRQPIGELPEGEDAEGGASPSGDGTDGDQSGSGSATSGSTRRPFAGGTADERIEVKGCRVASPKTMPSGLAWLFLLGLGLFRCRPRSRAGRER